MIGYADMAELINWEAVQRFRSRSVNPEVPKLKELSRNSDIYFQNMEAGNPYWDAVPDIVSASMDKVGGLTGRRYGLFDYAGHPDAKQVIIAMGPGCEAIEETVNHYCARGEKIGLVKVRLYRPFDNARLLNGLPPSAESIAVLDRTRERGAPGEPLYLDVCAAFAQAGRFPLLVNARYGLSSKEFNPDMVKAVFDNLAQPHPKNHFTVGIIDDVPYTSGETVPAFLQDACDDPRRLVGSDLSADQIPVKNNPVLSQDACDDPRRLVGFDVPADSL
jgi:pyruvate-ferredoxin/flavodoxin oxidoreductase